MNNDLTEPSKPSIQDGKIETGIFTVEVKKLLFYMLFLYAKVWCCVAVAGIFVFLILGICLEPVWFFLMLIWICIILPMMMVYLYFYYGMLPLTAINSVLHSIILSNEGIEVDVKKKEEETLETAYVKRIEYKGIKELRNEGDLFVVICEEPKGFLILPFSSFENTNQFRSAYQLLKTQIS